MSARARLRRKVLALVLAALSLALVSCVPASTPHAEMAIALLLPESKTARYEAVDRPSFEGLVARRCAECKVLYANADQDAALQQQQAEAVLTQGAGVIVLDAVDADAAVGIVAEANRRGVPVIAYDRFIANAGIDYYVSFDSRRIGQLEGEALARALALEGMSPENPKGVLMVNGAATDPNSAQLESGARGAFEGLPITVLAEYDTPDWSPDKAQEWVTGQLTEFSGQVDAVLAANDGTAGGAISAMRAAGLNPIPPVTGQDAELTAMQRIVTGDQVMTVYKAINEQARTAAELAVRVLRGESPMTTSRVQGVPALILEPVSVNIGNLRRVIIDGGVYTTEEICVQPYTEACAQAGLFDERGAR
jgi:D-xylose transport system substrate-binding protein